MVEFLILWIMHCQQEPLTYQLSIEYVRLDAIDRNSTYGDKAILWIEIPQTSCCSKCKTQSGFQTSFLDRWFDRGGDCLPVTCELD